MRRTKTNHRALRALDIYIGQPQGYLSVLGRGARSAPRRAICRGARRRGAPPADAVGKRFGHTSTCANALKMCVAFAGHAKSKVNGRGIIIMRLLVRSFVFAIDRRSTDRVQFESLKAHNINLYLGAFEVLFNPQIEKIAVRSNFQ